MPKTYAFALACAYFCVNLGTSFTEPRPLISSLEISPNFARRSSSPGTKTQKCDKKWAIFGVMKCMHCSIQTWSQTHWSAFSQTRCEKPCAFGLILSKIYNDLGCTWTLLNLRMLSSKLGNELIGHDDAQMKNVRRPWVVRAAAATRWIIAHRRCPWDATRAAPCWVVANGRGPARRAWRRRQILGRIMGLVCGVDITVCGVVANGRGPWAGQGGVLSIGWIPPRCCTPHRPATYVVQGVDSIAKNSGVVPARWFPSPMNQTSVPHVKSTCCVVQRVWRRQKGDGV